MPRELTDQARANVAAGATSGPGTDTCAGCDGPKEPTRLNSARCRACGTGGTGASASTSPVRVLRATLPVDVAERFTAEAAAHGKQANVYLIELIMARDAKKQARLNTQQGESS